MSNCVRRLMVATVLCGCAWGTSTACGGPIHLIVVPPDPIMPNFDLFANVVNPLIPGNPVRFLLSSDHTLATLSLDVDNHALFDLGIRGPDTSPVFIEDPNLVPADRIGHLAFYAEETIHGNGFDVVLDVTFRGPNGDFEPNNYHRVALNDPPPGFPTGSLEMDFAAALDPLFLVEIYVQDENHNRATLTEAVVPEPSTLVMSSILLGMFGAAFTCKRLTQPAPAA